MARLTLVHSACPTALLAHASEPFCRAGRDTPPLPLLAVRQGGIRDEIQMRAACAGASGWLGKPLVVFAELPALFAGPMAPLSTFERRALLASALERTSPTRLRKACKSKGFVDSVDALFGDLVAERVAPDAFESRIAARPRDEWEAARDGELAAVYAAYVAALAALPARDGVARSDGRDALTLAAAAVRERPDDVRRRLRVPFQGADAPRSIAVYGLNDLRRGWDHLLDALRAAPFVDELRVYLQLDHVRGEHAAVLRAAQETLGEHALLDALEHRAPDAYLRVESTETSAPLGALRDALFMAPGIVPGAPAARALAAPDTAREIQLVARRVKQLVRDGAAPESIAVVSRKSRPHGERMAAALGRYGVPVSARLRTSLGEVAAVAALVRVFRAAAEGFSPRALGEVAQSPYFVVGLDAALLKRAGARGRLRSLDAWERALGDLVAEAALDESDDDYDGPAHDRARLARDRFVAFRAVAERFVAARPRADWIALARECLAGDGLWGLRRSATRLPDDDRDVLMVEAARRDAEGIVGLGALLADWERSLSLGSGAAEGLTAAAWLAELGDALADVEVTLTTPQRRGVQVLEASAAAWRTFDHLFVVGMSAGEFPAEPGGRDLYAEHERAAIAAAGLPIDAADVWFAREASLFRTLAAGARRSLHLSYAYADGDGAPQIPSAYFDEVASRCASGDAPWAETVPGSAIAPAALDDVCCDGDLHLFAAHHADSPDEATRADATGALAHLAAQSENARLVRRVLAAAGAEAARAALRARVPVAPRPEATFAFNGEITSPDLLAALDARFGDAVWSASQLEEYGRCPFAFFGKRVLEVRELEEPDEDMDRAGEGALLHVCLDRLHTTLAADFGDAGLTSAVYARAEHLIPTIVERALDEFEATGRGGVPALRGYRARALTSQVTAYLKWEVTENEKASRRAVPRRRQHATELAFGFGDSPPVMLQRGGRTLRLRGKIDRVDELIDGDSAGWRYVVDHKSGSGSLTPVSLYDDGAILQLPLYLHALERAGQAGRGAWGGAYHIVRGDCSRTAAIHPRTLDKKGIREGTTKGEQESAMRLHDAVDQALMHVDGVTAGRFPAALARRAAGCAPYCTMRDVCREDRVAAGVPGR